MSETDCQYISSRGILKSCDIRSLVPHSSIQVLYQYNQSLESGKDGDVIYLCSMAVKYNIGLLKSLKYKFILVTGDSDITCPNDMFASMDEFAAFAENPRLIHWFSQNCYVRGHPKLTGIPIGMDYHTLLADNHHYWGTQTSPIDQEKWLKRIRAKSPPFSARNMKCYDNFTCTNRLARRQFGADRLDAIAKIPADLVYSEPNLVPRITSWKTQSEYTFVISPLGNGLDCHRTWEALLLGCIVIEKTSPIDYLYKDLPVWIVHDWKNVYKESLVEKMAEFKEKETNSAFLWEKLNLEYWIGQCKSFAKK